MTELSDEEGNVVPATARVDGLPSRLLAYRVFNPRYGSLVQFANRRLPALLEDVINDDRVSFRQMAAFLQVRPRAVVDMIVRAARRGRAREALLAVESLSLDSESMMSDPAFIESVSGSLGLGGGLEMYRLGFKIGSQRAWRAIVQEAVARDDRESLDRLSLEDIAPDDGASFEQMCRRCRR